MRPTSPRAGILHWLAPSADHAGRRVVVAGVAGVLLTAPLSLQQYIVYAQPLGYVLTAAGAVLAVSCCRRAWQPTATVTWMATLICVLFAAATITEGVGELAGSLRTSDLQLLCADDVSPSVIGGGQAVLHGSNPYTSFNVVRTERSLGCTAFHVTALRGGTFADRTTIPSDRELQAAARASVNLASSKEIQLVFTYPAGSAIVGIAGEHGVVVLTVLLLLVAGAAVVARSPPGMRRYLALALAAQTGAVVLVGPAPDGIVAALLIVACARRDPLPSGVALGLACAIKQIAWFMAPALLILAFRDGRRAGLRQTAATVGTFAAINVPFIAVDPGAWLRGVLAPVTAPEFPVGPGPIGLFTTTAHFSMVLAIFTATALLTVVGGWALALRGRDGWALAGVIVCSLALWDGPRSLLLYLGPVGLIAESLCARNFASPRAWSPELISRLQRHAAQTRSRTYSADSAG
jgi:hypothetical protein